MNIVLTLERWRGSLRASFKSVIITLCATKIIYQDASTFHLIAKVLLCCKPICYQSFQVALYQLGPAATSGNRPFGIQCRAAVFEYFYLKFNMLLIQHSIYLTNNGFIVYNFVSFCISSFQSHDSMSTVQKCFSNPDQQNCGRQRCKVINCNRNKKFILLVFFYLEKDNFLGWHL